MPPEEPYDGSQADQQTTETVTAAVTLMIFCTVRSSLERNVTAEKRNENNNSPLLPRCAKPVWIERLNGNPTTTSAALTSDRTPWKPGAKTNEKPPTALSKGLVGPIVERTLVGEHNPDCALTSAQGGKMPQSRSASR